MSGFPAAECIQSLIYFKIATITAALPHCGHVGFAYLFLLHQEI